MKASILQYTGYIYVSRIIWQNDAAINTSDLSFSVLAQENQLKRNVVCKL